MHSRLAALGLCIEHDVKATLTFQDECFSSLVHSCSASSALLIAVSRASASPWQILLNNCG